MASLLGWETVGGSFICIPNRLRIFFFSLKSPRRKRGQEEWQAEAALPGAFVSWDPWLGFQKGMNSEAPGIIYTSVVFVYFLEQIVSIFYQLLKGVNDPNMSRTPGIMINPFPNSPE